MRKKVIAGVVVVALLGGGGWWVAQRRSQSAAAREEGQIVPVAVKRGPITATISGTGPVASVNGVVVKANQTGTVAKLLAQDGDRVKAGQPVMVLKNDTLEANFKQAQIDLQNNQANLENLLNPQATAIRAQELKVENARLTLQQRQQDVANLRVTAPQAGVVTAVNAAEGSSIANNALLFTIYDETTPTFRVTVPQQAAAAIGPGHEATVNIPGFGEFTGMVRQGAGSATPASGNKDATVAVVVVLPPIPGIRAGMVGQASLVVNGLTYVVQGNGSVEDDSVEVRAQVAGTAGAVAVKEGDQVTAGDLLLEIVNESLAVQLKQAENDLATQQQSLANLTDPAGDPSGQLRTLRTKLDQSQVTLASRQNDLNDLEVKAPVDGQISSLTARVGDRITQNTALFRVADYGMMQVVITVDELDIAKARLNQKARITFDALPNKEFSGTVTKINPEGIFKNDIATFEVTVTVEKPEGLLAGMNATVNILVEQRQGLYLPAQAVQVRGGKAYVQVTENGQIVQKEIEVGMRTSQQVEVTGGLKENDEVILTIVRPPQSQGFGPFGGGRQQLQNQGNVPQQQAPAGGQNGNRPRQQGR